MIVKTIRIKDEDGNIKEVQEAKLIAGKGIDGDTHKGGGLKDLSMLDEVTSKGLKTAGGLCTQRFVENITFLGDAKNIAVHAVLKIGNARIEVTQKGKKCFAECTLAKSGKPCGLSNKILFAKIVESGIINPGNKMELQK